MTKIESIQEQSQERQPGREHKMQPEPEVIREGYRGSDKLKDKVALITGGDSGIGRAVAVHFAREGARLAIAYLEEETDAETTRELVEKEGAECMLIKGDIKKPDFCQSLVEQTIGQYGQLDVLVNNAAMQFPKDDLEEISYEQLKTTFETNIFAMFLITKAALKHLKEGSSIINTSSVTAYRGSPHLLDYTSSKGAITSFTRSLSGNLAKKGIRVNAIAPGPIWTPLIPSTFDSVSDFGQDTPMGRPGQPSEVAPAYVYLACDDSSYTTGQVIHVNGGELIGG
jgi:NAD(P)-dependent dehydrogenase (short-subunit alcohol dehydrogenase family)